MMTDIEGSTGLLAALGDAYAGLLDEVLAVQSTAITDAGGIVISTRADEVFAVFVSPSDDVRASVTIRYAPDRSTTASAVRSVIGYADCRRPAAASMLHLAPTNRISSSGMRHSTHRAKGR